MLKGAAEPANQCFALLDDCEASEQCRSTRLYRDFAHERVCTDPLQLEQVCAEVDTDLRAGLHAVVLGDYDWGVRLQQAVARVEPVAGNTGATPHDAPPALRVLLFRDLALLSRADADAWLAAQDESVAGLLDLMPSVSRAQFDAALASVRRALEAGDSYQINYTFRLGFSVFGTPLALYRRLRARQPVRYGALLALPDDTWVLSCSPELFLEHHDGLLRARPMKGTAARPAEPHAAARSAAELAASAKNRAENLMIVDLLRNDLGRIAETGSVRVPALFSIEPYAAVWQMTSTVEAVLQPQISFATLLRALFPCGSITGAPKYRTMQLIDALESTPRGLYTGMIGWLDGPAPASGLASALTSAATATATPSTLASVPTSHCGDFCLSVAIRTLTLSAPCADTLRRGTMGVGAGIVLDSDASEEFDECALKARFLTGLEAGFSLFETTWATREAGVRHLERHLARLVASARRFDFICDLTQIRTLLADATTALPAARAHRLRIELAQDGTCRISSAPLVALPDEPVNLMLADEVGGFTATHAQDPFLAHKTTRRTLYDRAWQSAEQRGAFDLLFFNQSGELTEGGRSNVFVKLAGRWYTPPLASGLLPGVMRAVLLDDPAWGAAERVILRGELRTAEALVVCNALRGALLARLL